MSEIRAGIISVGTELTEGIIRDAHGQYLSSELTRRGISVRGIIQLPDDDELPKQLKACSGDLDLLVVTGGLGPTADDLTRDAFAALLGTDLVYREDVWEAIVKRFPTLSGKANRRQAMIPGGCEVLDNPFGTAPGFRGKAGAVSFFVLPGPPRELTGMAELHLFPAIEHLYRLPVRKLSEASVFLIGESKLEGACREVFDDSGLFHGMQWGTRVQERRISLYLRGGEEALRYDFLEALRIKLGRELVRDGDVSAESLLISALQQNNSSFSVAESCTGGMVGSIITSVPGVSPFFSGGCISYSNGFKQTFLNVRKETIEHYGAVSEQCAIEMAEGILEGSGSDIACSITGIAGPSGGTREKPVGTVWLALAGKKRKSAARSFLFGYNRDSIRRRAAVTAMLLSEKYAGGDDALDMCRFWQYS